MNYADYLLSPEWRARRRRILRRAGGRCEQCGKNRPVQVHHLHYRSLGFEADEDLQAVCLACHEEAHA